MSDSDNDLLPGNVFSFQKENTTMSARGPNINITGLSFRNNVMTSTMNMQRNFERQRHMDSGFDQRSMYYRRDTSPPMSLHSGSGFRRNHQNTYYRSMSCQRSMINGRSGSPMSVRSIDSNATVSARDIAMALNSTNFNKYDLRVIKDAYNKLMKRKIRKKVEKRRNLRLFLKGYRRRSGYDSGELGSDSSLSSDDCRSTNTAFRDNISCSMSTRTDVTNFRKTIKESHMYKDCTENLKQKSFRNMFDLPPANSTHTQSVHNFSIAQRNRTGFLLPSQRFNKSVASIPILEKENVNKNALTNNNPRERHDTDSEQEQIFNGRSFKEKSICQTKPQQHPVVNVDSCKRNLENNDKPSNKRIKLTKENETETLISTSDAAKDIQTPNEFQFAKPKFPIRKPNVKVQEKLISKSGVPLTDFLSKETPVTDKLQTKSKAPLQETVVTANKPLSNEDKVSINEQSDLTSDVSMRPSFIKRKLYTQKLDVMENKNLSNDNIVTHSPQTSVYTAIQKEKNKARKLVTNQSCLSRDVQQEDDLLDLIHKIVPPKQKQANRTQISDVTNSNSKPHDDKWDVTSVISTCNNDDVSDTFTDEEIFKVDNDKTKTKKDLSTEKTKECNVLIEKLPNNKHTASKSSNVKNDTSTKGVAYKCVKSFWDTDMESDLENNDNRNSNFNNKDYYRGINRSISQNTNNHSLLSNSKLNLTKTNNIISQVKKLDLSLSLMKKSCYEKRIEPQPKDKKNKENKDEEIKVQSKNKEPSKDEQKAQNKRIILDQNSLSDATQNVSVSQNKKRGRPPKNKIENGKTKVNDTSEIVKKSVKNAKIDNIQNSKKPKTQKENVPVIDKPKKTNDTKKSNTKVTSPKAKSKAKNNLNNSVIKRQSPRIKELKDANKNTKQIQSTINSSYENEKSNAVKAKESKLLDNSIAKRKPQRTPKGFRCCVDMSERPDISQVFNTSNRPKRTLAHMKSFLDNNNSTLSDGGTLDDIIKMGSAQRALRSKNLVVTPANRSRACR